MRSFFLLVAALALPSIGQISLSGEWAPLFHEDQPERGQGPELGDYLGLPITEGARFFAESWDASTRPTPGKASPPASGKATS